MLQPVLGALVQHQPGALLPGLRHPNRVRGPVATVRSTPTAAAAGRSRLPPNPGFLCVCQAADEVVVKSETADPGSDLSDELVVGVEPARAGCQSRPRVSSRVLRACAFVAGHEIARPGRRDAVSGRASLRCESFRRRSWCGCFNREPSITICQHSRRPSRDSFGVTARYGD